MKAYISVDIEGMPGIASRYHLSADSPLFEKARRVTTEMIIVLVEELFSQSFEEVLITDSHSETAKTLTLKDYCFHRCYQGIPRPVSIVS